MAPKQPLASTSSPALPEVDPVSVSALGPAKGTIFAAPLPNIVSSKYLYGSSIGRKYALYNLGRPSREHIRSLEKQLAMDAMMEGAHFTIGLPPIHNFPNQTLRDVFEYHTATLLDPENQESQQFAASMFIVAWSEQWERDGLLLVGLDVASPRVGVFGTSRVFVDQIISCMVMLETDSEMWRELKAWEWAHDWKTKLPGYDRAHVHKLWDEADSKTPDGHKHNHNHGQGNVHKKDEDDGRD